MFYNKLDNFLFEFYTDADLWQEVFPSAFRCFAAYVVSVYLILPTGMHLSELGLYR